MGILSKPGSWWFNSVKDPRWNVSGHVDVLIVTGGMPQEAQRELDRLKEKLGDPPDDLMFNAMKD